MEVKFPERLRYNAIPVQLGPTYGSRILLGI